VADQLMKTGKVVRGRIGVNVQELSQRLAQSFGFPGTAGALVTSVDGDGAAEWPVCEPIIYVAVPGS